MLRILFVLVFVVLASIALVGLIFVARSVTSAIPEGAGTLVPTGARRIAYVALVVLLSGLATGWIGAA